MNLLKISLKYSVVLISIGVIVSFFIPSFDSRESNSKIVLENVQEAVELPLRLRIPSIHVDAMVEHVGLANNGEMDVPKKPDNVAWFNLGSQPGEIGSSVIAGHSGYKDNRVAAFDNLYKLQKGDKIYVENEKGKTLTFIVQGFKTYALEEDASSVFSSNDNKAHLNLITCTGDWDDKERTRSSRLVVFTDKE